MTILKAFKSISPNQSLVKEVASVPYDVINRNEAFNLADGNPNSFLRIIRSEIEFSPDESPYGEEVYQRSKENLGDFLQRGVLIEDQEDSLYIYRIQMGDTVQTGIVGCSSVDEYDQGLVKIHEKTRPDKENDRVRHMLELGAHVGPVFLTFRQIPAIKELVEKEKGREPLYDFTADDNVQHTVWRIPNSADLEAAFSNVPASYVADGHHRAKSASRTREEVKKSDPNYTPEAPCNFFLSVLFPHDELKILPYNRAIKTIPGDASSVLDSIGKSFDMTEGAAPSPEEKGLFSMYLDGKWYGLKLKPGTGREDNPVSKLDVSILQDLVLAPIFGIADPRTSTNIDFIGGIRGTEELEKLVNSGKAQVAFSLFPVLIEELLDIADAGMLMPPKSTWFEPKLRSGLFVHLF